MDAVALVLVLVSGIAYFRGSRREGVRRPPLGRGASWAFYGGLVVLVVSLGPPVDALSDRSFSIHMIQHLLIVLVAPPLLALGAPVTMLLRTVAPGTRRVLTRLLRSRVAAILANPLVGWVVFVGVTFGFHLSPLFDLAIRSRPIHAVEHAAWLASALIFWWPIVGRDPSPHRVPYPVRLLSLLMLMPLMSFLALSIYAAPGPLYPSYGQVEPWGGGPVADQQTAAVVMWLAGNLLIVGAMLAVAVGWKRDEEASTHRAEAAADRLAAQGGGGADGGG